MVIVVLETGHAKRSFLNNVHFLNMRFEVWALGYYHFASVKAISWNTRICETEKKSFRRRPECAHLAGVLVGEHSIQ
jgi:hypothetical protein